MTLASVITRDRVMRLRASGKSAVLAGLSRRAAAELAVPAADINDPVNTRERLGSTGVGAGVALPHARIRGLPAPVGFFARLDSPVDWGSIDGRPVDLVCLMLSSPDDPGSHLAALAMATRRLREAAVAAGLRAAKTDTDLFERLIGEPPRV